MKLLASFVLSTCFVWMNPNHALGSEEPRNNESLIVSIGLAATAVTIPLGVNMYSVWAEERVSGFWHWSGYILGGGSVLMGSVGLVDGLARGEASMTWVAAGFLGYGAGHIVAASLASAVELEEEAGLLMPIVALGEQGERYLGVTWSNRF